MLPARLIPFIVASTCLAADPLAVLTNRCLSCHNPKSKISTLDLSTRESALKGGAKGPAFKPGSSAESLLIERIRLNQMPPTAPLPQSERDALRHWIDAGAPWTAAIEQKRAGPDWWSLQSLPSSFSHASIDQWIKSSEPASRRTLIRRVTFDLTGLPPSPEEIDRFLNDASSTAYDRLLDRLLSSPHYGERWARHWLDIVRFSESEGFERDLLREHAWPFRDYVVQSFNQDKSYLQFAREQIAGDVLEPVTHDGIVATGFLVAGPTDAVGLTSAVAREREAVREDQLEELVAAVSQTFLGITVNCARCHDHKFDPVPQRDYYRMRAAFSGVWQPFVDPDSIDLLPGARPILPTSESQAAALRQRIRELEEMSQSRFTTKRVTSPLDRDVTEKTLEAWITVRSLPTTATPVLILRNRSGFRGASLDGIQYAAGKTKQWENQSTARFRSAPANGPEETAVAGDRLHLAITYSADGTIRLYRNGKPYGSPYKPDAGNAQGRLQTYFAGDAVIELAGSKFFELLEGRLHREALTPDQIGKSYAAGPPTPTVDPEADPQIATLRKQLDSLPAPHKAFAVAPRAAEITHVLGRGDIANKGEVVSPAGLSILNGDLGLSPDASDAERRRKMAGWIASEANPLFARAIVNRVWYYHFGAGLAENPSDLGFNGGKPNHPELLDWLASEFIRSGWSLKKLHKLILTSAAYRQSWRDSPRRLEGEAVRDAMLAASGVLDTRLGGPGFRPFTVKSLGGSYSKYEPRDSAEPDLQRRTVYRMNANTGGDPMLESLDCPVPSVRTPKRPNTTTPLQALSLMNSALAVRLSKAFAARLEREAPDADSRIRRAFHLAFGRDPLPSELSSSRTLALETLCWGLFNASEFLYVD